MGCRSRRTAVSWILVEMESFRQIHLLSVTSRAERRPTRFVLYVGERFLILRDLYLYTPQLHQRPLTVGFNDGALRRILLNHNAGSARFRRAGPRIQLVNPVQQILRECLRPSETVANKHDSPTPVIFVLDRSVSISLTRSRQCQPLAKLSLALSPFAHSHSHKAWWRHRKSSDCRSCQFLPLSHQVSVSSATPNR